MHRKLNARNCKMISNKPTTKHLVPIYYLPSGTVMNIVYCVTSLGSKVEDIISHLLSNRQGRGNTINFDGHVVVKEPHLIIYFSDRDHGLASIFHIHKVEATWPCNHFKGH